MAIHRAREDDAGNRGDSRGLSGTATGTRWIAWHPGHVPHLRPVTQWQRSQTAALNRIESRVAYRCGPGNAARRSDDVRHRCEHTGAVARHTPLDAAIRAASAHARLPDDLPLLIGVERIHDSRLLTGEEHLATRRECDDQRRRAEVVIGSV